MLTVKTLLDSKKGALLKVGQHRVVFIDKPADAIWLMAVKRDWAFPDRRPLANLLSQWACDPTALVVTEDVLSPKITHDEETLKKNYKDIRDKAWLVIAPLVDESVVHRLFDQRQCGREISARAEELGIDRKTIYTYLYRFWAYGMAPNALLPDFANCGAFGSTRRGRPPTPDASASSLSLPGEDEQAESSQTNAEVPAEDSSVQTPKRIGRPYSAAKVSEGGVVVDFNTQDLHRRVFQSAIDLYWEDEAGSLTRIYGRMVRELFTCGLTVDEDGVVSKVPMHPSKVPTKDMFLGWFNKQKKRLTLLKSKLGPLTFEQSYRAMHGRGREHVLGPGSRYQIDATLADVYLVHSLNRRLIIGRPVVYLVVDTFSTMIVGFYIGLEGPSWKCARLALRNAFTKKPAVCLPYGVKIEESDWPCDLQCIRLGADRQELLTNAAEILRRNFKIECEIAPAYRPDLKFVETRFRLINLESNIHFLPGAVTSRAKEWGRRDYRLDATLDLLQFGAILIRAIIHYNTYHDCSQHRLTSVELAGTDFPATPINLWNWGRAHGLGSLKQANRNICLAALCPRSFATITARGICFEDRHYETASALAEDRFDFVRAEGQERIEVAHDDEWTNEIWIPNKRTGDYETASLRDLDATFRDRRAQEANDLIALNGVMPASQVDDERKAKAKMTAAVQNIVRMGRELTDRAVQEPSDTARLKGISKNRTEAAKQERARDAAQTYAGSPSPSSSTGTTEDSGPTNASIRPAPNPPMSHVASAAADHDKKVIDLLSAKLSRGRPVK